MYKPGDRWGSFCSWRRLQLFDSRSSPLYFIFACFFLYNLALRKIPSLSDLSKPLDPAVAYSESETPFERTYYADLLTRIKSTCGKLCDPDYRDADSMTLTPPGSPWSVRKVGDVSCPALFADPILDQPASHWPPPKQIPSAMLRDYTLDGRVPVISYYFTDKFAGNALAESEWTIEAVAAHFERIRNGTMGYQYGYSRDAVMMLTRAIDVVDVRGKTVLVVGSLTPWLESMYLYAGASQVYVLEYGKIITNHPQIHTYVPEEFLQAYRLGALPKFDIISSFSSLEHAGLGRFGDQLNPYGDVIAIARLWCTASSDTMLVLGLPSSGDLADTLVWNAHREYGKLRWPLATTNWVPDARFGEILNGDGVFIFKPIK